MFASIFAENVKLFVATILLIGISITQILIHSYEWAMVTYFILRVDIASLNDLQKYLILLKITL